MYTIRLIKILTLFFCIAASNAQVIITEVMYNLDGSDSPNEYVELYNLSTTDSADLSGWLISDKYSIDTIEDSGYGHKLPPGSYGVILEGDYPLGTGIYSNLIPGSTLLMKVDDSSIGNGLSDSDSLFLINSNKQTVDSLGWDTITRPGHSLERVRLQWPNTRSNWKISRDSLGTPGKVNSVQPLETDGHLLTNSLNLSSAQLSKTDLTVLTGAVVNEGLKTISGEVIASEGFNSLGSVNIGSLSELDTASFSIDLGPFTNAGVHSLTVSLQVDGDQDTSNNNGNIDLAVQYDWNTLSLNEFMARPNNDQTEFIELISNMDFTMAGWSISDNSLNQRKLPSVTVSAGSFIVIAPDSTLTSKVSATTLFLVPLDPFPSLNNSGDGIYVYDLTGAIVDSLIYSSNTWPVQAEVSTEKMWPQFRSNDFNNWKSALDHIIMTPGAPNSVILFETDGALVSELTNHLPAYPEELENFSLLVRVINTGLTPFQGEVQVSENGLELVKITTPTIKVNDTSLVHIELEGLTSGVHNLDILLSIPGDSNLNNNQIQDTVKVRFPFNRVRFNEFMPIPDNAQTEFIELQSDLPVILEGWSISDNGLKKILLPTISITNDNYPVIAADSSLISVSAIKSPYCVPAGFPSLNNTSDGLFLYDMTGKIIDSLIYNQNWPILAGRSTEKFRPNYISNDSSRWGLAVNQAAATPGSQNSIYYKALSKKGTMVLDPNPFSPDNDALDDQLFIKYKLPFEQGIVRVQIFDVTGRSIAHPFWDLVIPQEGVLIWDGKMTNGQVARIGLYVIKFSVRSLFSSKNWETVQTVVLAKALK
ncbi:MAG: lamin tail domain-containing protein [Fidelibacterota bacterium]